MVLNSKKRALFFSAGQQEMNMNAYEEYKTIIMAKFNTTTAVRARCVGSRLNGQSPVLYLFPNIKVNSSCNILMFCLLFVLLIYFLLTKQLWKCCNIKLHYYLQFTVIAVLFHISQGSRGSLQSLKMS